GWTGRRTERAPRATPIHLRPTPPPPAPRRRATKRPRRGPIWKKTKLDSSKLSRGQEFKVGLPKDRRGGLEDRGQNHLTTRATELTRDVFPGRLIPGRMKEPSTKSHETARKIRAGSCCFV